MRRHLGEFEHLLLLCLCRLDGDATGTEVRRHLETAVGRVISPGAIYTGFQRLEERGYVRSAFGEPTPQRGGKAQRLYRLTPPGRRALADAQSVLSRLAGHPLSKVVVR